MNDRTRNITVGLVTLISIFGLMLLLLLFGYMPKLLQEGYFVTVKLDDAASLNSGSRVELAGIDIGSVSEISFATPYGSGVEVRVRIRDNIQIPDTAKPVIDAPLLGGSPKIKFVLDQQQPIAGNFLSTEGDAVVEGKQGAIAGAFGELERISNSIETLAVQWNGVGEHINRLLEPQDMKAVDAGEIEGNITTVVARVERRLAEMKELIQSTEAFIKDEELRANVNATAENLRGASAEAVVMVQTLKTRYAALADETASTIKVVNELVEKANAEDGSLGKILTDPGLYDNMESAAERIGTAADEMKLLIEKWKAEGVPVKL